MADRNLPVATLARMVDLRIPLPYLMTGGIVVAGILAGMYYEQKSMARSLEKMEAQLSTVTEIMTRLTSQQALNEYRLQKLEAAEAKNHGGK